MRENVVFTTNTKINLHTNIKHLDITSQVVKAEVQLCLNRKIEIFFLNLKFYFFILTPMMASMIGINRFFLSTLETLVFLVTLSKQWDQQDQYFSSSHCFAESVKKNKYMNFFYKNNKIQILLMNMVAYALLTHASFDSSIIHYERREICKFTFFHTIFRDVKRNVLLLFKSVPKKVVF